jgi:membrane protease YdiL (CAAX protease family)
LDWLLLAPTALLGGILAGTWTYVAVVPSGGRLPHVSWNHFLIALALPIAAEVLFRGFIHGLLAQVFRTQTWGGGWFLSYPVMISTLLYALWSSMPLLPLYPARLTLKIVGTVLFGLSTGMARERSESLFPPIVLHLSAVALLVFERGFLLARL